MMTMIDYDDDDICTGHSVDNWAAQVARHFECGQEPAYSHSFRSQCSLSTSMLPSSYLCFVDGPLVRDMIRFWASR